MNRVFRFLYQHKIKLGVGALLLLLVGSGFYNLSQPKAPEYITAEAVRGDLVQKVEIVGEVTSERDLKLQFPRNGVVSKVNVQEGDKVTASQILAQVRAGDLLANISSNRARVETAQAELRALEEGTRPEDIAIAEAELSQKKASLAVAEASLKSAEDNLQRSQEKLAVLKQQIDTNLSSQIFNVSSITSKEITTAIASMRTLEDLRSDPDFEFALEAESYAYATTLYEKLRRAKGVLDAANTLGTPTTYEEAESHLQQARVAVKQASDTMYDWYNSVANLPELNRFNRTEREAAKSDISTEQRTLQTSVNTLDTELRSLQNNAASYNTQIATEESNVTSAQGSKNRALADIATFTSSINISEAQLQLKRAGTRQSDIDASRARVRQAQADLNRAQSEYADTILRAPIDGTITKVDVNVGEFSPAGPAITMLGESPYRIEVFVPEIDIPKVALTQTGYIELEAFPDIDYDLVVNEIDPAATDRDGVPKYRVVLDFVYKHDVFKIGMTGDAEIITNSRSNVVYVPGRAVIENAEGNDVVRVLTAENALQERTVEVGMEGEGGNVEIISGIEEGETVVVLVKE